MFIYDSGTGLYTQLTNNGSYKNNVAIDGDYIVYEDASDDNPNTSTKETDIYLNDLSDNTETKLTSEYGRVPDVFGNYVVYRKGKNDSGDLILHEIQ